MSMRAGFRLYLGRSVPKGPRYKAAPIQISSQNHLFQACKSVLNAYEICMPRMSDDKRNITLKRLAR